eukprot:2270168-Rhodomonas_salina.1
MVGPAMQAVWVGEPIPGTSTMTPVQLEDYARQARAAQTMTSSGLATQTQADGTAQNRCAVQNKTTKPT